MAYNNDYGNYRSGSYSTGRVGADTNQWDLKREPECYPNLCAVHRPLLPTDFKVTVVCGADNAWHTRSSSPVKGSYGYADQASRIAPSTGANWRQQPHQTGHHSGTGYSDYNDYNNKPSYKHGGKSDNYDDHYRKTETSSYAPAVNMISNLASSRAKPSRTAHSSGALPVRGDGRLSVPTDDMERALHYLRESARTSSWPRT